MKRILLIIALALSIISCNKENSPSAQEDEYVVVNLSMLDVEISEMVKSSTECNDIIGVDVLIPVEGGYESYAYGIFDNYDISVSLKKGKTYLFRASIDKDSKDKLFKWDSQGVTYIKDGPFYLQNDNDEILNSVVHGYAITNKFIYAENTYLAHDTKMPTVLSDGKAYIRPDIERYYGTVSSYTATQDGTVSITMEKGFFGLEIVPSNFTEGVLTIHVEDGPDMIISYPEETKQVMYAMKDYAAAIVQNRTNTIKIAAEWKDASNVDYSLGSTSISIRANTKATITIKLPDPSKTGGVAFVFDDSPMNTIFQSTIDGAK